MKPTIPSSLPEPDVPESCLIREAAPAVVLTAGLRERVLLECGRQIRVNSKVHRVVTGAAVLAVAAVLLMCVVAINDGGDSNPEVTNDEAVEQPYRSPDQQERIPPNGAPAPIPTSPDRGVAIGDQGMPKIPGPGPNNDDNCAEELIEQLYNRRQIFESRMFPRIR